jgi:hypothetical protein
MIIIAMKTWHFPKGINKGMIFFLKASEKESLSN